MKGNPLKTLVRAALSCSILAAALLIASCDYWSEEWYRNGETTAASNGETGFYGTYMLTEFELPDGTRSATMTYEQYTSTNTDDGSGAEAEFLFFSGNTMTAASIAKSSGHRITVEHTGKYSSDSASRKLKMTSTEVKATADGISVESSSELVNYQQTWGWSSITSYSVGTTREYTYSADKKEIRVPAYGPAGAGTAWSIYTPYGGSLPAEFSR